MPATREDLFLNHIGRYRMSIHRVAETWFFRPEKCQAAIESLKRAKSIQLRSVGKGSLGFAYMQLTAQSAKRLNVPESRIRPMNAEALHKNLAMLWFCMFGPYERVRFEPDEYPASMGPAPNKKEPLCIEKSPSGPRFARIIVPGSTAGLEHTMRTIRTEASALLSHPDARRALESGHLRFVVLVEVESRRQLVLSALKNLQEGPLEGVAMDSELAPGPNTLHDFLRGANACCRS